MISYKIILGIVTIFNSGPLYENTAYDAVAYSAIETKAAVILESIDLNTTIFIPTTLTPDLPLTPARTFTGEYRSSTNINSKFYPQAPFGDWSVPWDNTCEEASVLLIANTYNSYNWTASEFAFRILDVIQWENQNLLSVKDTNALQTEEILNNHLNLKTLIHYNPTLEQVKEILSDGHLIVGFFAGKLLGNPNYLGLGPNFHVFVIKGYTADNKIITHDVGTTYGEDYQYDWPTLQNAMHDLYNPIENGPKRIIEVFPPAEF